MNFWPLSAMAIISNVKHPAFLPEMPEGVDLFHVAGGIEMLNSCLNPLVRICPSAPSSQGHPDTWVGPIIEV